MSLTGMLNQSVTVKNPTSGRDKHGQVIQGSPTTVAARVQLTSGTIVTPQNEREPIHAVMAFGPATTVEVGARVTYNAIDYRLMSRQEAIGGEGALHHITCKAQLWSWA